MTSRNVDLFALVFCSPSSRCDRATWSLQSYMAQSERERRRESESESETEAGRLKQGRWERREKWE